MATPDRIERIVAEKAATTPTANDPFFGATRRDVTINGKTYQGAIDIGTAKPPAATEIGMVSPISGLTISGTERNMAKEREAMNIGYTKEYIASRGGINSQGYFNDTPLSGQLTADEYKSVTLPDGSINTVGMARILQEKQIAELVAQGVSKEEATRRISSQYGKFGLPTTVAGGTTGGATGGYNAQGIPTPGGQYNAQGQFVGTSVAGGAGTPEQQAARKSAYDLLYQQFDQYGLGALVEPLKNLVLENVSPAEFAIRLRETDAYKKRFAANQARVQKGLRVLSEAQYIDLEDKYQDIMRRYGLPETYYSRGDMGRQEGFEKFISGDVSPTELEDRIQVAQRRVINAAPEVTNALRSYYPEIGQGEMLAYFLDPTKAIEDIRRKVTAAEIGGAATMAGLNKITPDMTPEQIAAIRGRAEELARYGVTGETARKGFQTIAEVAPRGSQLSQFYGEPAYTQTTAEQETFGLAGATEAARQRKKLTQLEQASFAGRAGATSGALARERAGSF